MPARANPAVIDAEHARFLQGAVSIIVASRNASNQPELVRAHGCRVSRDRRQLRLFVDAAQAGELLADLHGNGLVAVVFTEPSSHRSLQVKGEGARIVRLRVDEPARVEAYRAAMVGELGRIGISEALTRALLFTGGEEVALQFAPMQAFVQTPGPDAGRPLGANA